MITNQSGAPVSPKQGVLMLTPELTIGGMERMILSLSSSLQLRGEWSPFVLSYDYRRMSTSKDHLLGQFERLGISVEQYSKPARFSVHTVLRVAWATLRGRLSVIHSHDLGALIYGALAKVLLLGRPRLVHTQHSFINVESSWKQLWYERVFSRMADEIAVVSEEARQTYLRLRVPSNRLHLIPNGVCFPTRPIVDREDILRARQGLSYAADDPNEFWLVYLARIHPRKGQDHALRLWSEVSPEIRRRSRLFFVGPETCPGEQARISVIVEQCPDQDRITWIGATQGPEKWLQACDLFLSCSESEGMPLAPVEAVGSGVPSVLSEIEGHRFLSAAAELYPLDRPEAGAAAVESIFEKTFTATHTYRRELWVRSRAVRDAFTIRAMADHYQRLYQAN